jgi:hypothetical protein
MQTRIRNLSGCFLIAGFAVLLCAATVQGDDLNPAEPGGEEVGTVTQALVDVSHFSAHWREGGILASWGTVTEIDTAGFNILRRVSGEGDFVQANDTLIPPTGPSGGQYEYLDEPLDPATYDFQLEEIDNNGISTIYGLVTASVFEDENEDDDEEEGDFSCTITGVPSGKSRGPGLVLLTLLALFFRRRA